MLKSLNAFAGLLLDETCMAVAGMVAHVGDG